MTASPSGDFADEIGADQDAPVAVVAVDGGRPLREFELRDGGERHGAAGCRRHHQVFEKLAVAARAVGQLDADRHLAVADVEFGEVGADVADGGDADGFGNRLGRNAKVGRDIRPWIDTQFRPVEFGGRDDVEKRWDALGLARQLGADAVDLCGVGAADDELQLALAVVLHEPVTDVGNAGEIAADLFLDFGL